MRWVIEQAKRRAHFLSFFFGDWSNVSRLIVRWAFFEGERDWPFPRSAANYVAEHFDGPILANRGSPGMRASCLLFCGI